MEEMMIHPSQAMTSVRCNTIADALDSDTSKLSTMTRQFGRKSTENYLALWLAQVNTWFKVTEKMTLPDIEMLASMLYAEYYYLNVADLVLIFKGALKQPVYNRLDMQTVVSWFDDYASRRAGLAECQQYTRSEARSRELPEWIALNSDELKKIGKL